ncbi:MAG: hypothetical protein ACJAS4_001099 [Bacteriovoracaceae bacterium]|jgi:hypothetical protein
MIILAALSGFLTLAFIGFKLLKQTPTKAVVLVKK